MEFNLIDLKESDLLKKWDFEYVTSFRKYKYHERDNHDDLIFRKAINSHFNMNKFYISKCCDSMDKMRVHVIIVKLYGKETRNHEYNSLAYIMLKKENVLGELRLVFNITTDDNYLETIKIIKQKKKPVRRIRCYEESSSNDEPPSSESVIINESSFGIKGFISILTDQEYH